MKFLNTDIFFALVPFYFDRRSELFASDVLQAYDKRYKEFGPIYKECYGPVTIVVVTNFNEYNKVIRSDGKMPRRIPLEPLLTYRLRNGLDTGMVNGYVKIVVMIYFLFRKKIRIENSYQPSP